MGRLRVLLVFWKLVPCALALRNDRREWSMREEKDIDVEKYRKSARRALNAFLSLGPVYIKLGQWLSSRADILPQPYMAELSKLQDDVPAAPFEQVRPIIERQFGSLDSFERFDRESLSGASLGQVYRARRDGMEMVVKVKRPGIERIVREDLKLLKRVLPLGLQFIDPNLRLSGNAILTQFIESIREEMDYTIEKSNLKQIKSNMAGSSLIIPDVYDRYSSRDIITMEYVPGTKVTDIPTLDSKGIDRTKLVIDVHKIFFKMLLRHSLFHADPHPGNISVADDGRLILYDYGMVGRLDDESRRRLVRLYLALVEKNPSRIINAMNELGMLTPESNRSVIEQSIELAVRAMHGRKPSEMEVDTLIEIANRTMSRFPFVLPKNLALYMRMASIIEGIYQTHDVDFKFVGVLREVLEEENLVRDAYAEEIRGAVASVVRSLGAAVSLAPDLKRYLDDQRSLQYSRPRPVSGLLLPSSIVAGAVFVGSALLYSGNETVGIAGMACSLAASLVLAVSARKIGY